jgi:hypothetical protein
MKSFTILLVVSLAGCSRSSTEPQVAIAPKDISPAMVAETASELFSGRLIEWESPDLLTVRDSDGSEVVRVSKTTEPAHEGYWPIGGWLIEGRTGDVARFRGMLGGKSMKPVKKAN